MLPGDSQTPMPSTEDTSIPTSGLQLEQFHVTTSEKDALYKLKTELTMYVLQKNSSSSSNFLGLQNYMQVVRPKKISKSNVVYWQVLNAPSESKGTTISILQDLHRRFIVGQNKTHVIVEGDAKLYEVLQSLKREYGDELKWLLVYPGDWHLLKNYQIALVKPYFETGLKELAKACKYPVAAIKSCSQFKRSHNFILEAWEAIYRVIVERFLETSDAPLTMELVSEAMKGMNEDPEKGKASQLSSNIESFKATFNQSNSYVRLTEFVNNLSAKDPTWKFWSPVSYTHLTLPTIYSV